MAQISMKLLALFADMERIFMLERVHDARAAKAKRGKPSGPKPKLTSAQRQALAALMADEDRTTTAGDVAAGFGISRATSTGNWPRRKPPRPRSSPLRSSRRSAAW